MDLITCGRVRELRQRRFLRSFVAGFVAFQEFIRPSQISLYVNDAGLGDVLFYTGRLLGRRGELNLRFGIDGQRRAKPVSLRLVLFFLQLSISPELLRPLLQIG